MPSPSSAASPAWRLPGLERSTAVVGLQWGDEGKGKIVDLLAAECDAVVRYNGGANAGHSVEAGGKRLSLHLVPSGVLHQGVLAVIGNGVVVDPEVLLAELAALAQAGVDTQGLRLSQNAHVVMPYHMDEDAAREAALRTRGADGKTEDASIGTTGRGIGPAYADKAQRAPAIRVADLLRTDVLRQKLEIACELKNRGLAALDPSSESYEVDQLLKQCLESGERLTPFITDTVRLLHDMAAAGKRLLFEGANGTLLDVDHGAHPYVTSSSCSTLGAAPGTGLPLRSLGRTLGVMKAYATRVGAGPFPTEQDNATGDRLRQRGREYGTTTGRPRRTGWLDLVAVKYAVRLNGCDSVAITLLDVLAGFDELKVCTKYKVDGPFPPLPAGEGSAARGEETDWFIADSWELSKAEPMYETLPGFEREIADARSFKDLPTEAQDYVRFIEEFIGAPASLISVGPDRAQTIVREG